MRTLAVLNILFALSVAYAGMAKIEEMRCNGMFDMDNFGIFPFIAAASAFIACATAILALEKPFAKYLYIIEVLLYFVLCAIISSPVTAALERVL